MHYAAELYAFLFFQIFLWAIRRCDYLQDPSGNLHLSHHWGIQVIPMLTISFWNTLSRWGIQQHTGRTDIKHTGITGRIRNYGQHGYPETLGEEEAVICARKSCGVDFFFQADIQKVQIQAQAEGGEGSGLAQGLGSTVMENCLTAQSSRDQGQPLFQTLPGQTAQRFISFPPLWKTSVGNSSWEHWRFLQGFLRCLTSGLINGRYCSTRRQKCILVPLK